MNARAINPPPSPFVRRVWSKLLWWRFLLFQRHRYDSLTLEQVQDVPFVVLPQVFNPKLMRTGAFMADVLSSQSFRAAHTVLDLGTGSGVGAIFAARFARHVVATDINPEAVRCARINILLNHLDHKIDVRQGDVFEPARGEIFDLILFNPPFYKGRPRDALDFAWRGEDVIERFAHDLRTYLSSNGFALLLLSTKGDTEVFLQTIRARGLSHDVFAERELINEKLTVYKVAVDHKGSKRSDSSAPNAGAVAPARAVS